MEEFGKIVGSGGQIRNNGNKTRCGIVAIACLGCLVTGALIHRFLENGDIFSYLKTDLPQQPICLEGYPKGSILDLRMKKVHQGRGINEYTLKITESTPKSILVSNLKPGRWNFSVIWPDPQKGNILITERTLFVSYGAQDPINCPQEPKEKMGWILSALRLIWREE